MTQANPDHIPTISRPIQTNPDQSRYVQTNPDHIQIRPDTDPTGPENVQSDVLTSFPTPPYTKTIDEAFLLFSKEGLVERRRTVTRWAKRGLFDAKQDPRDRNKWWLTEGSMMKKFDTDLKRKQDRVSRKKILSDFEVNSTNSGADALEQNGIEQGLGDKGTPTSDSEADKLKKELASAKIGHQRAEENLNGMDRAAVNMGFGFSQSVQLVTKEKMLLEHELQKALPPEEFKEARSRIDSEINRESAHLMQQNEKRLQLNK